MHPDATPPVEQQQTAGQQPAHVTARSGILGRAGKLKEELVTVEAWADHLPNGGQVLCIELDAGLRADLLQAALDGEKVVLKRIYPDLLVAGAHHPDTRAPLFLPADKETLLKLSGSDVELVASAVGRISGMDKDASKRAEGN